ncbi:hypothetical protein OAF16_04630 [Flavobacteriales bacterium]|nr:hypothetical protein [Flavobacteriales bacterium]
MKRGGKRVGAGRKSKAEEQSLIEKLTPLEPLAFESLKYALTQKKEWAVKMTFEYLFGKPKQYISADIEQTLSTSQIDDFLALSEQNIISNLNENKTSK